jgi:hypothetical protein
MHRYLPRMEDRQKQCQEIEFIIQRTQQLRLKVGAVKKRYKGDGLCSICSKLAPDVRCIRFVDVDLMSYEHLVGKQMFTDTGSHTEGVLLKDLNLRRIKSNSAIYKRCGKEIIHFVDKKTGKEVNLLIRFQKKS